MRHDSPLRMTGPSSLPLHDPVDFPTIFCAKFPIPVPGAHPFLLPAVYVVVLLNTTQIPVDLADVNDSQKIICQGKESKVFYYRICARIIGKGVEKCFKWRAGTTAFCNKGKKVCLKNLHGNSPSYIFWFLVWKNRIPIFARDHNSRVQKVPLCEKKIL